ncbi:hypothetical protein M115_1285 [Bacteroides fragilis str. 3719 T6]|nr:hypothetical protein M085_1191 [Bacteroides fragilis str. 3986 N(B)19]EXZ06287.1 hypothetical protein M072_1264 [Bacteroides fragilis str. DS-208]EYA49251.1 hypothetical protein M115_1285 [Bacteroides fragilis str. 3719 T6]
MLARSRYLLFKAPGKWTDSQMYNDLFSEQKEYPNAYPCAIMGDG